MNLINGTLDYVLWSNSLQDYLIALGLLIGFLIVFKIFKLIVLTKIGRWAKKTKTDLDDELVQMIENIPGIAYFFVSLYIALQSLIIPNLAIKIMNALLIILAFFWATKSASDLIEFILAKHAKKKGIERKEKGNAYFAMVLIAKIILWGTGFMLVLSNLGINISALVASLGIGGIAIALAAQNILSDMFSSFSIYFDKPFEIGDYIVVGDQSGTVKKIGIKTTRVQALQGEEIVFSNKELTSTMVRNFKKLKKRRIVFEIHATYDTPNSKMEKIPTIIDKAIKSVKLCDLDRAHFREFGDSGLIFEVVYFIKSSDYKENMNARQEINFAIKEAFEKEKINMAFPTQTIHMVK